MSEPEFSRLFEVRQAEGRELLLTANPAECAALAKRFGLVAIERLEARVTLTREGEMVVAGAALAALVMQTCAVSGEPFAVTINEPLSFRFVPAIAGHVPDQEIDLDAELLDEIEYSGTKFDLGEAVAQSLALAIDPFAVGPDAEEARRNAGLSGKAQTGPFAALAKLKR